MQLGKSSSYSMIDNSMCDLLCQIMTNYLQVTSIAISINVAWDEVVEVLLALQGDLWCLLEWCWLEMMLARV